MVTLVKLPANELCRIMVEICIPNCKTKIHLIIYLTPLEMRPKMIIHAPPGLVLKYGVYNYHTILKQRCRP